MPGVKNTEPETSGGIPNTAAEKGKRTWQQTKSELTRTAIMEAMIACFYEHGYANTTTENVSTRAGVSRGAMLHHFPSRADLIGATVRYLNRKRIEIFAREEFAVQQGAEHSRIDEGIETFWQQLKSPEFIVFHELKVAARTDPELERVMTPAQREFAAATYAAAQDVFPDLAKSESFQRANYLTLFVLEGMALDAYFGQRHVNEEMMLDWLKSELARAFHDVSDVPRNTDHDEGVS